MGESEKKEENCIIDKIENEGREERKRTKKRQTERKTGRKVCRKKGRKEIIIDSIKVMPN